MLHNQDSILIIFLEVLKMARCPYLEYESRGALFSQGDYYCDLCKKTLDSSEVNNKCNPDYGDEYEKCPTYKER